MKTKKITVLALLTAAALIIFVAEAQIPPPIPVPGIKLGLSNVVILTVLYLYGPWEAAAVLLLKITLGSLFSATPSAFIYSAAGGIACFAVMALLSKVMSVKQLWALSAFGAIFHNAGQLTAAVLILGGPGLWWYAPVLLLSGIVTGVFTGLCARPIVPRLKKMVNGGKG